MKHTQSNEKDSDGYIRGAISVSRRGVGYLPYIPEEQDIEIEPEHLGTALHGDYVAVELLDTKPGERRSGKVVEIIEREKERFVGVAVQENGTWYIEPDDPRMYARFQIPDDQAAELSRDAKAVVRLAKWSGPDRDPLGTLEKVLGPKGDHEVEMAAVVIEHGFALEYPPAVEKQAQEIKDAPAITDADRQSRRDFRDVPTFTIDPDSAKDFDDALSVTFLDDETLEVGIHIADVSHYVQPGTPIDKEARRRGTSVYLVDRTIHMLPPVLSQDVCSLNPNEDKLAFSAVFTMKKDGTVTDQWFGDALINSDRRFTYDEAQTVIDGESDEYAREITTINEIAKTLRKERVKEGAIAFEHEEVEFELDEDGKPIDVHPKPVLDANKLIEEFMLLANRKVAYRMYQYNKERDTSGSFMYRVHDQPNPDKIEELATFVRAIGHEFETDQGEVSAKEINRLFDRVEGTPEEQLIKTATIRTMAKAVYSTKNIGHFGLSFDYYTHFTSPIRRYPDVLVHRLFKKHLRGEPIESSELAYHEKIALEVSESEAEASSAERDSIKYKQVEYLAEHVGETFDATISGVTDRGIFVKEKKTHAEGMVRLGTLGNDYYEFKEGTYRLVGKDTGDTFKLGDEVRVKLTDADIDERKLFFEILEKM